MRWWWTRRGEQKPKPRETGETIAFSGDPSAADAPYLDDIRVAGGAYLDDYKKYSYTLLKLNGGLTVLDAGCGDGQDLSSLSAAVGPSGSVIGLDRSVDLLARAQEKLRADTSVLPNIRFLEGDVEHIPLSDETVDRARTDRAMQHFTNPATAVREIWRVLRPGGGVTLIEPDWGMMVLYPGSVAGGDDDSALSLALQMARPTIAHPLMGRQLYSLLRGLGESAWGRIQIQAIAYTITDWKTVDSFLSLSDVVELLGRDDRKTYATLRDWIGALQDADRQGTFLAVLPLFIATAWKKSN